MYRALCVHADPHRLCACENARGSGVDDPRSLAVVNVKYKVLGIDLLTTIYRHPLLDP